MSVEIVRVIADSLNPEERGTEAEGFREGVVLVWNGAEAFLDLSPAGFTVIDDLLAPYLEAGELRTVPEWGRWPEGTSESDKRWHYKVKLWAVLPDRDGRFPVGNADRPTGLAGPATERLIALYLKAHPKAERPESP